MLALFVILALKETLLYFIHITQTFYIETKRAKRNPPDMRKTTEPKKTKQTDPHVSVSFSFPTSVKEDMDRRAKRLRISRTDYVKTLVLWELDKGEDAPFNLPRVPRSDDNV